ncbi:MAG TPA: hypothetical protein VF432_01645 [Thermoanaerobaculia bacterium]
MTMKSAGRRAVALAFLWMTACAAVPPAARVVPSEVDTDDGAFDITARLPGTVCAGTTVEVTVIMKGRLGIATYDHSAIDFSIGGRGLLNARVTPIGGEAQALTFLGEGGTVLARGRRFGPGSRLGFTVRFDIAPEAMMRDLQYQIHATAYGGAESRNFVRNYVATFVPSGAPCPVG